MVSDDGFVPNWLPWPSHACAHYTCNKLRWLTKTVIDGEEIEIVRRWCPLHSLIWDTEALVQGGADVIQLKLEQE